MVVGITELTVQTESSKAGVCMTAEAAAGVPSVALFAEMTCTSSLACQHALWFPCTLRSKQSDKADAHPRESWHVQPVKEGGIPLPDNLSSYPTVLELSRKKEKQMYEGKIKESKEPKVTGRKGVRDQAEKLGARGAAERCQVF